MVAAALPGTRWRTRPSTRPYTTDSLEIQAWSGAAWVEIGEGGVAASHDPRVRRQMADLTPYRPVSARLAALRDLSVACRRE